MGEHYILAITEVMPEEILDDAQMDALKNTLIISMLQVLSQSQHSSLPIKIFEIGDVVVKCEECYTGWRNECRVSMARMDSIMKFEDLHADVYAFLRELGVDPVFKRCKHALLIDGRCACISINDNFIGVLGEVKPEILEVLEIRYPIAIAEINLEKLLQSISRSLRVGV